MESLAAGNASGPMVPSSSLQGVPSVDLESKSTQHSKVLDLPPELTMKIFSILCQPVINEELDNFYQKASQPTTPLFLGSICRSWRSIIWDTPTLWCFVLIILSDKVKTNPERIELLKEWLLRTRNLPLTIILTSIEHHSKSEAHWDNPPPDEVFNVLVKHAEQWENVDMLLPSGYGGHVKWNTILAEVVNRLPLLSSLNLRPPRTTGVSRVQLDMFSSAPLLRHFTLDMYYVSDVKVPWSQLVSLHVERLPIQECLQILPWCHNLRRCQINGLFTTFEALSAAEVRLEHLLCLKLTDCEPQLISSMLSRIFCPALQELYLDPVVLDLADDFIIPILSAFFIRSSPVLKVLTLISFIDPTDNALLECLELIPSLETLILRPTSRLHPGVTRWFLQKLNPSECLISGSTIALPNLQKFTFKGVFLDFPAAEFLKTIKNRWSKDSFDVSIKQLKFADISFHGDYGINDMDRSVVLELLKAGMDITFDHVKLTR